MTFAGWSAICAATVIALVAPIIVRPILERRQVVDVPNDRSSQTKPTVRGGGVCQLLGVVVGAIIALVFGGVGSHQAVFIVVAMGALAMAVLGLIDDVRRGLKTYLRMVAQVVISVAAMVALGNVTSAPAWAVVVAVLCYGWYVNAVNFMDGINGITSLHGLIVGVAYAILGAMTGLPWLVVAGGMVAGAYLAFLPWNVSKRGLFLGDVGSYLLGAAVAGTAMGAAFCGVPVVAVVAPVWIYVVDTGVTIARRIVLRRPILQADRDHVYQRLVARGLGHLAAAGVVAAFSAVCGLVGLAAVAGLASVGVAILVFVLVAGVYLATPAVYRARGARSRQVEMLSSGR